MKAQINIIRVMSIMTIISLIIYFYCYSIGDTENLWKWTDAVENIALGIFGGSLIAVIIALVSYFVERSKELEIYFNQYKKILEHGRKYPKGNLYDEKVEWFNVYKDLMISFSSQASRISFIVGTKSKKYLMRIAQYYNEFTLLTQNAFLFLENEFQVTEEEKNQFCKFIDDVMVEIESVKAGILTRNIEFIRITHNKELVLKNINEIWKASFKCIFKRFRFEQTLVTEKNFQILDDKTEKYVKKIIKIMDKKNTGNIESEIPEDVCKTLKAAGYLHAYENKDANVRFLSCQFIIYHYFELKKQLKYTGDCKRKNEINQDVIELGLSKKNEMKYTGGNKTTDLLVLMLTSMVIPMIAHTLDIAFGEANAWSSERILALYFAAVSGYIVSEKLFYVLKQKNFYQRGIKLGDSDAIPIFLWIVPMLFVMVAYETVIGMLVVLAFACAAIGILLFANEGIILTKRKYIILVGFVVVVTVLFQNITYDRSPVMWIIGLTVNFVALVAIGLIFDIVSMAINKLKHRKM